jgi:hypothetical protein
MKHKLVDYFRRISPLSDEEAQAILDSMVVKTCPKGTHLLMADQVCTEAYFVLQGCVRQYYIVDGEERSNGFFTEDEWVLSIHSMMNQTPADHFLVCAEDTTMVVGTEQREGDLYRRLHAPGVEGVARAVPGLCRGVPRGGGAVEAGDFLARFPLFSFPLGSGQTIGSKDEQGLSAMQPESLLQATPAESPTSP